MNRPFTVKDQINKKCNILSDKQQKEKRKMFH